jgi:uncharacterized protein YegL
MAGKPLENVETGVQTLLAALQRDPHALESVYLSIITFDAKARVAVPLEDLSQIRAPKLSIRPGTAMGAALKLVQESISRDVRRASPTQKGDFRPLIFILTDGQPTDEWEAAARDLKNMKHHPANVYAIGCGEEVDFSTMLQIADVSVHLKSMSTESLAGLFLWLSASVQSQSVALVPDGPLSLEKSPLKKGMELIGPSNVPQFQHDSVLYFHVRCRDALGHYLMRYRFVPETRFYEALDATPLPEDFFSDGAMKSPPVDASKLYGAPKCPFCQSQGWGKCGFCGHLFCLDHDRPARSLTCPHCQTSLTIDDDGASFTVDGSQG